MMRNFYQTSTGRSYQYGTSTNGTNNIPSNQIRYPPTAVAYSQFSPLTAAGIRQVKKMFFTKKIYLLFLFRIIHYLFKILIGIIKVSHHFVLIIHPCFIIQLEQCVRLTFLQWKYSFSFFCVYVPFCSMNKIE